MNKQSPSIRELLTNRDYVRLLLSQAISSLGDSFQLVAITLQLVQLTGSGLNAGFAMIATSLASLLLSPLIAIKSTLINERRMLVLLDLLRALITFLFISLEQVAVINFLLFALASMDILYSPARNKMIKQILHRENPLPAVTLQNGVNGAAFLIGPVAASVFINRFGVDIGFALNSFSFVVSALILLGMGDYSPRPVERPGSVERPLGTVLVSQSREYNIPPTSLFRMAGMLGFTTTSVSLAFYSLAFDSLRVSNQEWSVLLSLFNGTGLLATAISLMIGKRIRQRPMAGISAVMLLLPLAWLGYGFIPPFSLTLPLLIFEGTLSGLLGIFYLSQMLAMVRAENAPRFTALCDFFSNAGKILGMGMTISFLPHFGIRPIFVFNALLLLVFVALIQNKKTSQMRSFS